MATSGSSFTLTPLGHENNLGVRGTSSLPDLLLAHPNLTPFVYHHLIQSPGGAGHKILSVITSNSEETHAP
ncbi:hypothetical protein TNCV_3062451 [Trichonephila clavipes]|nr:hypothetical protein TNCV_3062451 [Trichonephila clavipes]